MSSKMVLIAAQLSRSTAERVTLKAERDGLLAEVESYKQGFWGRMAARNQIALRKSDAELTKALEDLRLEKLASAAIRQQAEDFKALSWERGQELTKARELFEDMLRDDDMPVHWFAQRISDITDAPAAKGREAIDLQRDRSYRDGVMAGFGMGLNNNEESYKRVLDSLNREIHAANRSAPIAKGGA